MHAICITMADTYYGKRKKQNFICPSYKLIINTFRKIQCKYTGCRKTNLIGNYLLQAVEEKPEMGRNIVPRCFGNCSTTFLDAVYFVFKQM